jgi:EAL domain-containing protein (putative c-di-GMP-specific phosphodiesterase class I)
MASDAPARAIIEAIIRLAQAVGLEVIAEGVETEVEANLLRMLNCDQFQGYHFARPMPAADYLAWLAERTRSAPAVVPARVLAGLT